MVTAVSDLARAKVNLFLHVGPVDAEGYHPLASLVAFADIGDRITVAPADRLSLTVTGPFAAGLDGPGENLILTALRALGHACAIGEPPVAVTLDKRLPIAAGLGGGSSDAGTALRLTRQVLALPIDDAALSRVAATVGADGPMCLFPRSAWAEGRGDVLTPEPSLPPLFGLLVNPGVPSPTGAVYRAYDDGPAQSADRPAPPRSWEPDQVIAWLAVQRNDLQDPAVSMTPAIGQTLTTVAALPGVILTRMSGSGATVFGLCRDHAAAEQAATLLRSSQYKGWISACVLSD